MMIYRFILLPVSGPLSDKGNFFFESLRTKGMIVLFLILQAKHSLECMRVFGGISGLIRC